MSDFVRLCQIMSDFVGLCRTLSNLLDYVRVCQIILDFRDILFIGRIHCEEVLNLVPRPPPDFNWLEQILIVVS